MSAAIPNYDPPAVRTFNRELLPARIRTARVAALAALAASGFTFVRANDAEASAIFDAGGDAGMWGLGIFVVGILLAPGGASSSSAALPALKGGSQPELSPW